jgi:hypothetical protein
MSQGRYFSEKELQKIVQLLSMSEMSISEIAERMNCSKGAIMGVNRRFAVRDYSRKRNQWKIAPAYMKAS